MKRVADTAEPPIVIPVIVVAVHVHVTLIVVPLVERGQIVWSAISTTVYSILILRHRNAPALHTKYLHFLKCLHTPSYLKP